MRFAWVWIWDWGWKMEGMDRAGGMGRTYGLWDWIGEGKASMIPPFFLNHVACGALALIFILAYKSSSQINIHSPSQIHKQRKVSQSIGSVQRESMQPFQFLDRN